MPTITAVPDKTSYLPGETAVFTMQVTDPPKVERVNQVEGTGYFTNNPAAVFPWQGQVTTMVDDRFVPVDGAWVNGPALTVNPDGTVSGVVQ